MPLYEYKCHACNSEFELLIRGSEEPTCPQCESPKLQKQFSVPAAQVSNGLSVSDANCGAPQCGTG